MKNRKKRLRQLIVAFVLLYTIGLPIKNIVLANANEVATNEAVVTEEAEINEDKTIVSEENEQPTEENIQEEKEISEESTSAVAETVSSEQHPEEITDNKEEVKKSNLPVEAEKAIEKDVKAVLPDKISAIFLDANLAEVIRDTLRKSSVDDIVTQAELDTISSLRAQYVGIVNLSGMENLTNLTELYLYNNQISDISPLSNLTNLNTLYLWDNQISDISPLSNLTNLDNLALDNNQISDISPLSNLTNLNILSLWDNQISDISPLSNLTNIGELCLDDNQISDMSPLSNLTNLYSLAIRINQISDISPLSNLTNLGYLDLEINQINDISPLSNLTNLSYLNLWTNQISDISPLSNLTNLTELFLENNQISDISPLSNLTKLRQLYLEDQNISASKVKWNDPLSVTNTIKDENGNLIAPSLMSDQGTYTDPTITWTGLTNTSQSVSYSWGQYVTIGTTTTIFYGTINLPVEKSVQYNVNFDIDGQVTTELVEAGELVTKPQDPNKDGYAFIGWYDAEIGGTKWDFSTDTMPANDMTLYARFNKLGFVTPGVDPITPSVEPPTTPGERPNPVTPSTPGADGNQTPSNASCSNTGNMTITSQENTKTSPEASEQSKLAQLGEQYSIILQGVGLLMVISGIAFFWWKRRKKAHS
ncbi:internalin [Listeria monocytogenes]|nr:internalin [Listeria monocytogenes]